MQTQNLRFEIFLNGKRHRKPETEKGKAHMIAIGTDRDRNTDEQAGFFNGRVQGLGWSGGGSEGVPALDDQDDALERLVQTSRDDGGGTTSGPAAAVAVGWDPPRRRLVRPA